MQKGNFIQKCNTNTLHPAFGCFGSESVESEAAGAWQQMRVGDKLWGLAVTEKLTKLTFCFKKKDAYSFHALSVDYSSLTQIFVSYRVRAKDCEKTESINLRCCKVVKSTRSQFVVFLTQTLLCFLTDSKDLTCLHRLEQHSEVFMYYVLPKVAVLTRQHPASMDCGGPASWGQAGTENLAAAWRRSGFFTVVSSTTWKSLCREGRGWSWAR